MRELEGAQRAHEERAARRAVRIEVADHEDAARAVRGEQLRRALDPSSVRTGSSRSSDRSRSSALRDAARGIHSPQHRMQVRGEIERRCRADAGGSQSSSVKHLPPGPRTAPEPLQPARAQAHAAAARGQLDALQPARPQVRTAGASHRSSTSRQAGVPGQSEHGDHTRARRIGIARDCGAKEANSGSSPAVQPRTAGASASAAPPPHSHSADDGRARLFAPPAIDRMIEEPHLDFAREPPRRAAHPRRAAGTPRCRGRALASGVARRRAQRRIEAAQQQRIAPALSSRTSAPPNTRLKSAASASASAASSSRTPSAAKPTLLMPATR